MKTNGLRILNEDFAGALYRQREGKAKRIPLLCKPSVSKPRLGWSNDRGLATLPEYGKIPDSTQSAPYKVAMGVAANVVKDIPREDTTS